MKLKHRNLFQHMRHHKPIGLTAERIYIGLYDCSDAVTGVHYKMFDDDENNGTVVLTIDSGDPLKLLGFFETLLFVGKPYLWENDAYIDY